MTTATIRLFLSRGDAKSLRTAEIINWTGMAVAAPRTELDEFLARDELGKTGIYILLGSNPKTDGPHAYIGEAEVIRDRLRQHKQKEFWVSVIVFTSKDENLTKAHVRYLESRLIDETLKIKRFTLEQNQSGGARLPESDRHDMDDFLYRIRLILPVLGCDILTPIIQISEKHQPGGEFLCTIKNLVATGQPTANGFVVFSGSKAVLKERPSAESYPYVLDRRKQLISEGVLVDKGGFMEFTRDVLFSSPSSAAAVIHGGSANGLLSWKTQDGIPLKDFYKQP